MNDSNDQDESFTENQTLDTNLSVLISSALEAPAKPMSPDQIHSIIGLAARRAAYRLETWLAAGMLLELVCMALIGLSGSTNQPWVSSTAVMIGLANLSFAPAAAFAIIFHRRKKHA